MENFSCQRCICSDPFLRPPEVPIFKSTSPQAKSEMLKMQKESKVYQSYLELCGNKTFVPEYSKTSSTTAQTTVVPGVTTLKDVTTEVTNITSLQNDTLVPPTSILSSSSQDSNGWWIALLVIGIILLAVIVVGVYVYKKKGKKGFRKSVMYQNLSQCFFWNNLPTHQNRTASFSSVGSKKSESSVGQIQPNSRIDQDVVYYTQVSNNEKDFKHSSTAQLIDAPLSHTDEEYSNPAIECTDVKLDLYDNSSKVSFRQSYSSDTQTDNKASEEGSKKESNTSQKDDSDSIGKADTIVSTYETCSPQTMSKSTTDKKADTILSTYETVSPETMSKPTTKEKESDTCKSEGDSSSEKPSSGTDIASVYITLTSETEESSSKKPQFNIELDSHTANDGRKSSIQNQKSVDSGYESRINSPEQECV